jgi:Ankyrin repeats (3 copies)
MGPRALRQQNKMKRTPLHCAIVCNQECSLIRFLATEAEDGLHAVDQVGRCALHLAAETWSLDNVQWLATKRPDSLALPDWFGDLPLHCAALAFSTAEVAGCLADAFPAALGSRTNVGSFPLNLAARHASLEVVRCLADARPGALDERDNDGWLPLHLAAAFGKLEVVRYLADARPGALDQRTSHGWLHLAASSLQPCTSPHRTGSSPSTMPLATTRRWTLCSTWPG